VKHENQPFHEARGQFEGNCLDFNVFLVKAVAFVYFAYPKGVYHHFVGFLSAAT